MEFLKLEGINYAYKNGQEVLKGINMAFQQGKIYAIVGPSGCGKTTLLSLLGGLDEPNGGTITINGENIDKKGLLYYRKNQVSFVFQQFNLIDYLTAAENVSLLTKKSPFEMLKVVGLAEDQANRSVLQLSGGQQQRVAVARALMSDANLLLADEPTGNLDEETAAGIIDLLKESAHQMNKCVIVVTHSHELAAQADIVFQLKKGQLEEEAFAI